MKINKQAYWQALMKCQVLSRDLGLLSWDERQLQKIKRI